MLTLREMHAPAAPIIPSTLVLTAYRTGIFPMANDRADEDIFWVEPRERAIIPLDGFHLSRSLARLVRRGRYHVTCNKDFAGVIRACAEPRPDHPETWISHRIEESYRALHRDGHAHSLECWQGETLVGGLYGLSFDRVFCGESMFSRAHNASKVALVWLVAMMRHAGFRVLDCQFMTDHLASLGAITVSRQTYLELLRDAGAAPPHCSLPQAYAELSSASRASPASPSSPGKLIVQSLTQTS